MRARHTQLFTNRAACRASSEPGASSPIFVPTRSAPARHTALSAGEPTTSCVTYAVTKMMACAQARSPAMRARHASRQTCAAATSATTTWMNQTQVPLMRAAHPGAATCLTHRQGLALNQVHLVSPAHCPTLMRCNSSIPTRVGRAHGGLCAWCGGTCATGRVEQDQSNPWPSDKPSSLI